MIVITPSPDAAIIGAACAVAREWERMRLRGQRLGISHGTTELRRALDYLVAETYGYASVWREFALCLYYLSVSSSPHLWVSDMGFAQEAHSRATGS